MKKLLVSLFFLLTAAGFVFSQNVIEFSKVDREWSVKDQQLVIGIEAETKGWIAVGLGSSRMDGSIIFIGYSKNGEAFFQEHLGKGHSHRKTAVQRPVEYEVTETDGVTRLEFSVAKSDFVSAGDKRLPVIVAYGARDDFTSLHRYRDSTVIEF